MINVGHLWCLRIYGWRGSPRSVRAPRSESGLGNEQEWKGRGILPPEPISNRNNVEMNTPRSKLRGI